MSDDEVRRILPNVQFPAPALSSIGSDVMSEAGERAGVSSWTAERPVLGPDPPPVNRQIFTVDESPLVLQISEE